MKSRLGGSGSSLGHNQAWEILPWYVNGSLESDVLEKVGRHLTDCEACRQEVAYLQRLNRAMVDSEAPVPAAAPAFQEALSRVEYIEARRPRALLVRLWEALNPGRFWRPLLALQSLMLIALALTLWQRSGEAPAVFHTLSRPVETVSSSGLMVRMVFSPDASEEDLRELLLEIQGQIVEGPSPYGVYTVEIRSITLPDDQAGFLEDIRAREEVEFLEPLLQQR